ncbi:MAG: hypothetical protein QXU64_05655, partial [Thermofilaceae archaeon]
MERAWEIWREMRRVAVSNSLDAEKRRRLASLYRQYNEALPPEHRDTAMVILGEKPRVIPREEIPRLIMEDDDFYRLILK